jgi:Kef-type K+ transport system membrane component KefB
MFKVGLYSLLLISGLVVSQFIPRGEGDPLGSHTWWLHLLTTSALAFIMIHVGHDFDVDKRELRSYAFDYGVAAISAAIPWIFCTLYIVLVMTPRQRWSSLSDWENMLLLGRFAAPTSAGILFSMLAAAGLGATWVFGKARVLAIFDDVDTILAVTLLQIAMVGFVWQLAAVAVVTVVLLWIAWRYMRTIRLPQTWPLMFFYAVALASVCEGLAGLGHFLDPAIDVRLEVLLPAFVLGCIMAGSPNDTVRSTPTERRVTDAITGCFMFLVGATMPPIEAGRAPELVGSADQPGFTIIALHVLALTVLSNLGKMFPVFCYRQEASSRERVALGISMFPRGEVGAGVLVISLGAGIDGTPLIASTLSLAFNLICTGLFILFVKRLLVGVQDNPVVPSLRRARMMREEQRL